jgi:excisionase family DNA binding protein
VAATNPQWRSELGSHSLRTALAKRAAGVPTYSVSEAAALLSVSRVHLYRLIHADAFPAVRMALAGGGGRFVIPARAVERLLGETDATGGQVEVAEWTARVRREGA